MNVRIVLALSAIILSACLLWAINLWQDPLGYMYSGEVLLLDVEAVTTFQTELESIPDIGAGYPIYNIDTLNLVAPTIVKYDVYVPPTYTWPYSYQDKGHCPIGLFAVPLILSIASCGVFIISLLVVIDNTLKHGPLSQVKFP